MEVGLDVDILVWAVGTLVWESAVAWFDSGERLLPKNVSWILPRRVSAFRGGAGMVCASMEDANDIPQTAKTIERKVLRRMTSPCL